MLKNKKNNLFISLLFLGFFLLFALISYWTPLAGDDWGYALNGMKGNPFELTYQFYFSWSGRIFSEFWGFVVAPNKWLWNILNPLLFTGIAFLIFKIINPKAKQVSLLLLILFLMLSVKDYVRMETYTWIMGTTYIVPLFLYLLYLYIIKILLFDWNKQTGLIIAGFALNIIIPLWMENIATTLILSNILLSLYFHFSDKKKLKIGLGFLLVSCIGFAILRLSPGASYRLMNEHSLWLGLSIFEKIQANWQNFLTYTFLDNKYLILILSLVLLLFIYTRRFDYRRKAWHLWILGSILSLGAFQSMASFLYSKLHWEALRLLFDLNYPGGEIFITTFFTVYLLTLFWIILSFLDEENRLIASFLVLVGGSANIVMLFSPIFGPRSSIYMIYIFILLIGIFYNRSIVHATLEKGIFIALLLLCLLWSKKYYDKYKLVNTVNQQRLERIHWLQENPETPEAWIQRMPIMTIHSADVEDDDVYHQEVFKEYYNLNPDMKLIFYWPEN